MMGGKVPVEASSLNVKRKVSGRETAMLEERASWRFEGGGLEVTEG